MPPDSQAEQHDVVEQNELLTNDHTWPYGTDTATAEIFPAGSFHLTGSSFHAGDLIDPQLLDASDLCFSGASYDATNMVPEIPSFLGYELGTNSFPASVASLDAFSDMINVYSGATSPGTGLPQDTPNTQPFEGSSWTWESSPVTDPIPVSQPSPLEEPVSASLSQQRPLHAPRTRSGLPRRRSRYLVSRPVERSAPIQVPSSKEMDPMQRWQESPPEDEPASLTAIMNAMDEMPANRSPGQVHGSRTSNAFRHYRQSASITSGEFSASSADSACSSAGRSTPQSGCSRRSKGRVAKSKAKPWNDSKPRIFCCTFCCDRFRSKYDWVRHEKSLHLNLETWYCAPLGPSVFLETTGQEHCAYCNVPNPSRKHLIDEHNYQECQNLSNASRVFRRKDHLVQHLRHVHQVNTVPSIDEWKKESKNITSRCGFCDQALHDWDERTEHIGDHFRAGLTMKDWQGDHGFPPSITAQLRNAFPPYLIGAESKSMIPFSSTNAHVRDHYAQMSARVDASKGDLNTSQDSVAAGAPDATMSQLDNFLGNFTRHLGQFAREQIQKGIIPTDEMFQQEARRVVFDCGDEWDQTIADNPQWLSSFKQLHCESPEEENNG
ncbi:uncharacterized protein N7458_005033 [Penicillium daleae]|uniref:C2H2-type domain-containing protein n=1 Tax=Penicillium daleae TaxID=63821 RepID=A0AAD6G3Y2_9EURO|nr:uncharacterized protein N7458_005033 [Penicillium daleae]KAJ5454077.1 hypothetical protein N7458_005033 [Penicillium daleae]